MGSDEFIKLSQPATFSDLDRHITSFQVRISYQKGKKNAPALTGPLSSSPVVALRCHSADAHPRRLITQVTCRNVGDGCEQCKKNSSDYLFRQLSILPSERLVSQDSSAKGVVWEVSANDWNQCCLHNGQKEHTCKTQLLLFDLSKSIIILVTDAKMI